jgi:hypothetical protein
MVREAIDDVSGLNQRVSHQVMLPGRIDSHVIFIYSPRQINRHGTTPVLFVKYDGDARNTLPLGAAPLPR